MECFGFVHALVVPQTNLCNHLATQLPLNTITEIELDFVEDAHIAKLADAMRGHSSVTSISLCEIATIDCYNGRHIMHVTNRGLEQLLKLAQNNVRLTCIDVRGAERWADKGFLDKKLWAAVQDACKVRFGVCLRLYRSALN